MTFVAGRVLTGRIYVFPHQCPGDTCAICLWLARKDERVRYEELAPVKAQS